jgi:NAD(P)-dependent dehydrogenase (short-subunit alcohol dehydrogenase family)
MEVYFLSAVRPIRIVTPIMAAQGGGSIVNISTAWVEQPTALFPTSTAFRASLGVFTKIYSDDFGPKNIRLNNVLPGWIDSLPEVGERRESVPLGRYGRQEEIAATVAFLLSDAAGYITGQSIRVDGGVIRAI